MGKRRTLRPVCGGVHLAIRLNTPHPRPPGRSPCLSSVPSRNLDLRPPPTMAVGNHVLAPLQIACKTIGGKCERRMAHSRPGQGVPTDRDRSPRCRRSYSPKIVPMVNEYIFRSGLTASPLPFHSSILGDDKVDNRNTEVYGREIQLEGTASQVLISNRISRKIGRCCVI